ncbi:putative G-protein coupled receptor 139 [Mustelus asterias]
MRPPVVFQIKRIYYPVLGAIGVPVNFGAIVILARGKCGLSKCITRYLVGMAIVDLLVVVTDPILRWTVPLYDRFVFLRMTAVCRLSYFLFFATTSVSVWLTVAFTFDRYVAICCESLKTKYCTQQTATVVLATVSGLGCLESIPWYFLYEPHIVINDVSWGCRAKQNFLNSPIWIAYDILHRMLTPCVPFCLILLLNTLTVKHILVTSQVRRGLRGQSNGENHKDPEMANRRKSIILLFSISGSFILLWVTYVMYNIYARVAAIRFYYSFTDPRYITDQASRMLQALSSCTNTCIYAVTQTKFREELKNALKYPFKLIVQLVRGVSTSCTEPGDLIVAKHKKTTDCN